MHFLPASVPENLSVGCTGSAATSTGCESAAFLLSLCMGIHVCVWRVCDCGWVPEVRVGCRDFTLPVYAHSVMILSLQLLNSLAVVTFMLPPFILWVVPMAYLNNKMTTKYRKCARELKRLSSNLRSPMFRKSNNDILQIVSDCVRCRRTHSESLTASHSQRVAGVSEHFNESINGLITVRAFDATAAFTAKSCETVDDCSRAQMAQQASPRWLGMRVSSLASVSIFITSFGILISPNRRDLPTAASWCHYAIMSAGGGASGTRRSACVE